ncbi:MAG: hypothetical protein AABY16_04585 [Nanoarchaeota archaeon]
MVKWVVYTKEMEPNEAADFLAGLNPITERLTIPLAGQYAYSSNIREVVFFIECPDRTVYAGIAVRHTHNGSLKTSRNRMELSFKVSDNQQYGALSEILLKEGFTKRN